MHYQGNDQNSNQPSRDGGGAMNKLTRPMS